MRQILKAIAFLAMLLPGVAAAQCNSSVPLPASTLLGRLGVGPGPCQAIPFAIFFGQNQPLASGKILIGSSGGIATAQTPSGDLTVSIPGVFTLNTVNTNTGAFGSATQCVTVTNNAKGLTTAVSAATCTPAIGSITGLGTGIAAALAVNVGSAGAPVLFNGAGGTPSSITLTNGTGFPTTGLTGALQAAQEPAHTGDVTNTAGSLALAYTNVVPASKGGAGTITGALKGSGAGVVSQAACADLSNGGTACSQTYSASTWVPAITTSGTTGTPAYTVQVGSYEQIGRQITVRFNITLSSWSGSPTGNIQISGLPLTSTATANDYGICHVGAYVVTGLPASNFGIGGVVLPSSNLITIFTYASTTDTSITAAQFGATGFVAGMCSYRT